LIAEIGVDMSRFPTHKHLALRGLKDVSGQRRVSGSARRSGKTNEGSKWVRTALTEAAHAAVRTKGSYLRAQYAGIKGRRGSKKAAVATGHSILVICYHLLDVCC
jgi:transposase